MACKRAAAAGAPISIRNCRRAGDEAGGVENLIDGYRRFRTDLRERERFETLSRD